ncbi:hypothetical protein [Bacteroides acidifaciens]|uniref:hypothetical protein n=1 Tax=Bacteroides acidifaciens TaxID=85831 RepID=UPI00248B02F9|nr:hypothetical protein [Bacteroides acidifaciens]
MVKEFTRDYLVNALDLPYTAVEDKIIDNSRWSIRHKIVFKDTDGKFYQTTYSIGATEDQDERPWEYVSTVKCTEVAKKKVVVERWIPVDSE